MILQDISDIKREVMSFLDMTQLYKAILVFKMSIEDVGFYLRSQDISIYSQDDWDRLNRICRKYGKINTLYFHYNPLKLGHPLSRTVHGSFVWKKFGIIRVLEFISSQKDCELIRVNLTCHTHWNFGVLSNLLNYQQNVSLRVEGPHPLYVDEMYLNPPCRMSNLEIVTETPIPIETIEKIQRLTDHLKIVQK